MRTIALFVDDASTARLALRPLLAAASPSRVILVACAPRLTRHVGRWLNQASRDQYRQRWARELFAQLQPLWGASPRGTIETLVAAGRLETQVARLRQQIGNDLVTIDARGVRFARDDQSVEPHHVSAAQRWLVPAAAVTSGLGLALALAD